jgi:hypothetical protein
MIAKSVWKFGGNWRAGLAEQDPEKDEPKIPELFLDLTKLLIRTESSFKWAWLTRRRRFRDICEFPQLS